MSKLKVAALQGLSASSDAITLANDGTCTANITNRSNRNIVINGAMQVAQRGTSSTDSPGWGSDRFPSYHYNTNEAVTSEQADVASGTTPYTLGFRKCIKLTNGNQTSGPQGNGYAGWTQHRIEAQNIAQSGWNYNSASSYITLSFWVKSSVAQDFKGYLRSMDGTNQMYPFATGSLSADTWTKVTKTIPGNSNIQIDNNNGHGLQLNFVPFLGTDYTDNSCTENAWAAYVSASRIKDVTTTWYNTNDATFELTGVQLEVGSVATDFEHRSYAQELQLCKRYYNRFTSDVAYARFANGQCISSTEGWFRFQHPVTMRSAPTFGSGGTLIGWTLDSVKSISGSIAITQSNKDCCSLNASFSGLTAGNYIDLMPNNDTTAYIEFSSEL